MLFTKFAFAASAILLTGGPAAPTAPADLPRASQSAALLEETYVTVSGVQGKLLVLPAILEEFGVAPGAEISQELMYRILERNRRHMQ